MNRRSAGRQRGLAWCRAVLARFGGLNRFVDEWAHELKRAAAERPGSPLVLRSFLLIAQGLQITEPEPQRDVSELSDEELAAEMAGSVVSLLETDGLASILADDDGDICLADESTANQL
ncbi:MAG: hypothetical protein K2Y37_12980 [Pirellulales bacterium]|nr:hypothetical protein [Pirellulales bacterium]